MEHNRTEWKVCEFSALLILLFYLLVFQLKRKNLLSLNGSRLTYPLTYSCKLSCIMKGECLRFHCLKADGVILLRNHAGWAVSEKM
jgi:hypothetical protein